MAFVLFVTFCATPFRVCADVGNETVYKFADTDRLKESIVVPTSLFINFEAGSELRFAGTAATSVGKALATAPNPSAIRFVRINADNTVSLLTDAQFLTAIGGGVGGVTSVNTRTGAVTLSASDVNLGNANNTSDANKPISTATQTALNLKTSASVVPNTAPSSGQILVGNGSAYAPQTVSGAGTLSSAGVLAITGAISPTTVNGITLSGSGSLANSGTSSLTGFTGSGTSSGTNTGDQTSVTGNAGTATALQNARTIGGSSFNGTANITSFPSPGAIGGTTPSTGAFTFLSLPDSTQNSSTRVFQWEARNGAGYSFNGASGNVGATQGHDEYNAGWYYNTAANGDRIISTEVQYGLGFESNYSASLVNAHGSTEHYFVWKDRSGQTGDRRLYQFNISHGGNAQSLPSGFARVSFNVDQFGVAGNGDGSNQLFADDLFIDFTKTPSLMRWIGEFHPDALGVQTTAIEIPVRGTTYSKFRFQNSTTGFAGSDGTEFGTADSSADFFFRNNEATGALLLKTNGDNERARITAGGRFLFGATTDSGANFQVVGSSLFNGTMTQGVNGSVDAVLNMLGSSSPQIVFKNGTFTGGTFLQLNGSTEFQINNTDNKPIHFLVNNSSLLYMDGSSVKITTPVVRINSASGVAGFRYLQFEHGAGPTNMWKFGYAGGATNTWMGLYNDTSGGGFFFTAGRNLIIGGDQVTDISGNNGLKLNGTSDATSLITGALQDLGGASITKALWVGGLVNIAGVLTAANVLDASNSTTAGTVISGGLGVAKKIITASTLTTLGGATFHTTSSALTDGAGVGTGTLLTAPTAGNPTKWIGINDNGTTRYVPAW